MEMLKRFYNEEEGMGTVEMVMLIAALMCVALLFREKIVEFANSIMTKIFNDALIKEPSS